MKSAFWWSVKVPFSNRCGAKLRDKLGPGVPRKVMKQIIGYKAIKAGRSEVKGRSIHDAKIKQRMFAAGKLDTSRRQIDADGIEA